MGHSKAARDDLTLDPQDAARLLAAEEPSTAVRRVVGPLPQLAAPPGPLPAMPAPPAQAGSGWEEEEERTQIYLPGVHELSGDEIQSLPPLDPRAAAGNTEFALERVGPPLKGHTQRVDVAPSSDPFRLRTNSERPPGVDDLAAVMRAQETRRKDAGFMSRAMEWGSPEQRIVFGVGLLLAGVGLGMLF